MFDVDWSDPNRESVGARRARKQKKDSKGQEGTDRDSGDQDGNRTSESVRSSVSSADKQFGFFGGKHSNKKKGSTSSRKDKTKSIASSSLRAPTLDEQSEDQSTSSVPSSVIRRAAASDDERPLSIPRSKRFSSLTDAGFAQSVFSELDQNEEEKEIEPAPGGSLFGNDTTNPQPGKSTLYQELGDGSSFVTKTTVTEVRDRTEEDSDFLVSKVHISTGGIDSDYHHFQSSTNLSPSKHASKSSTASVGPPTEFTEVVHRPAIPVLAGRPVTRDDDRLSVVNESIEEMSLAPSSGQRKNKSPAVRAKIIEAPAILSPSMRPVGLPDTWKAPSDWAMSPGESAGSGSPTVSEDSEDSVENRAAADEVNGLVMNMAFLEREITRVMALAPEEMIMHLRKEWKDLQDKDEATNWDVKVDWHADQHRYFLATLYHLYEAWEKTEEVGRVVNRPFVQRVLALFEDQATTTYLSAMNAAIPVYHMSTGPINDMVYSNIHPVKVPYISAEPFDLAKESFSCVSSLQILSQLDSAEIPKILYHINRVLAPGGTLNTITIDAWPMTNTAGPILLKWIDENLAINLELASRCERPSRTFPKWLRNAGMYGDGTSTTTTRFSAVPVFDGEGGDRDDDVYTADDAAADTVKELRTLCGRWLWKYIWMGFVTGGKCWWEVPEIVQECLQYRTTWEYRLISAVKSADQ